MSRWIRPDSSVTTLVETIWHISTAWNVMNLRDAPIPHPKDGEVLIRVGYAGVNPSDSKARSGQSARNGYPVREFAFRFVTGMDAAGVVERTGANVTEFSPEIA